jgi:hypothetical protein
LMMTAIPILRAKATPRGSYWPTWH